MRSLGSLLPLIVLAVLFYLLLIRPQRNRARQAQALLSKVGVGDTVMTSGGMFGTVAEVEDDAVLLEVSPSVEVRLLRGRSSGSSPRPRTSPPPTIRTCSTRSRTGPPTTSVRSATPVRSAT